MTITAVHISLFFRFFEVITHIQPRIEISGLWCRQITASANNDDNDGSSCHVTIIKIVTDVYADDSNEDDDAKSIENISGDSEW